MDEPEQLVSGACQWSFAESAKSSSRCLSFRSVRNIIFDLRAQPGATGLHWQVSQATSLINLVFQMTGNNRGIEMENGSGGFLGGMSPCPLTCNYW